jgi:AraC-like DNA-binding protein
MTTWLNQVAPQISMLWRGRWKSGDVEPARSLYDHEMVLVTEGSCFVRIGKREREVRAGEYIIIPPDTVHVTTTGADGVYRWCVHFDWIPASRKGPHRYCCYYPKRPSPAKICRAPAFVPTALFEGGWQAGGPVLGLLETLFHRWQTGRQFEQTLCRATFLELLVCLLWPRQKTRVPHRKIQTKEGSAMDLAWAVKDLLDGDSFAVAPAHDGTHSTSAKAQCATKDKNSVQARLASLGFSYPHLCRRFREKFGVTPVEYKTARRLEYAKALLSNRKLPVAEVAEAAGFRDQGYFTRRFRRQNGMTPSAFRREHSSFPPLTP